MMAKFTVRIDPEVMQKLRDPNFISGMRMDMMHAMDRVLHEHSITLKVELRYVGAKCVWVRAESGRRVGLVYRPKRGE